MSLAPTTKTEAYQPAIRDNFLFLAPFDNSENSPPSMISSTVEALENLTNLSMIVEQYKRILE